MSEGYMIKQPNGRYTVGKVEITCGECVEVKLMDKWVIMRMEHDGVEYYLATEGSSFYPRKVYVRF